VSEQLTLFESLPPEPEGLHYAADFVPPETEQKLIFGIQDLPLPPFQFGHGRRAPSLIRSLAGRVLFAQAVACKKPPGFPGGFHLSPMMMVVVPVVVMMMPVCAGNRRCGNRERQNSCESIGKFLHLDLKVE
jgi:hypothetical protein